MVESTKIEHTAVAVAVHCTQKYQQLAAIFKLKIP